MLIDGHDMLVLPWRPSQVGYGLLLLALPLLVAWLARRGAGRTGPDEALRLQLRKAEARIRCLEARLETVLQAASDIILVADADDRIAFANGAAAQAFGMAGAQLQGVPLARVLSAGTFASYRLRTDASRAEPSEPGRLQLGRYTRQDGSCFPVEYSLSIVPAAPGSDRFILLVARDITLQIDNAEQHRMNHEFQATIFKEAEAKQAALARELHDAVASSLAGVTLLLGAARLSTRDPSASVLVSRAQEQVIRSMQQVRQISRGIMPAGQEHGALLPALQNFVVETGRLPGVACRLASRGDFGGISGEVGGHLFRIVQEATNNAIRHGQAREVQVRLTRAGSRCRLTIQDDGAGCDPRKFSAHAAGIGIRSMRARAEAIGGTLSIRTAPGAGCRVQVTWADQPAVAHGVKAEVAHA